MSSRLKAELAATCSTLGRHHKGEYLIEPECIESVKDLIRYLKRDNEEHEIRRYLGESKVLQNDLIHIIKSCPDENSDLFDVTLRLLINLTTPAILFYGEEIPAEKVGRNIYLSLIGYSQDYKSAFCDVEFWNKICGKLTNLFEIDWTERSADDGIQIERILMLLRNVLQVPADEESEKRPENDVTDHDKVLWALRQSQILELLLFVSSNENEEQYYLNLLEIYSLILREQNPKLLALCVKEQCAVERNKDSEELAKARELESKSRNKYLNMRNFNATFVMKGVKSLSNNDVVCHKSLEKVNELDVGSLNRKQIKARRNRIPVESDVVERRSTFSVRLFLKEFCLEFLNSSFSHLMGVVKNKLDSGKSLANDQTYYFWALKFFLDFATASNSDVSLIKDLLSTESFHFVQTSMDNAFEHLLADKKKTVDWVKRIHLILKSYHSLLETLLWMDCSKSPLTRSVSREIKSQIFYVVEYREMTLNVLLKYDPTKFSVSYLRDLVETTHLFIKLLEDYSKQTKLIVQKVTKKRSNRKKKRKDETVVETNEDKWEKIKDDVYDTLCSESLFPEIPPFDAALEIPIDDQKGRAMKRIQKCLHEGRIRDGIGLLRSARQVWPENDCFGSEGMSVEDETMALQEICLADMKDVDDGSDANKELPEPELQDDEEDDESEEENQTRIVEQDFDIMDYKKRLVNKKVVEGCGILLKNYKKNSDHTNHCVIKLLHRIGWECCMPAMLYQASLFWTFLKIMREKNRKYEEINTFALNLLRKFRKHATNNPVVFLELLFWKEHNDALEIQHGYQPYEVKPRPGKRSRKKKVKEQTSEDEEEELINVRNEKDTSIAEDPDMGIDEGNVNPLKKNKEKKKRRRKTLKKTQEVDEHIPSEKSRSGNESDTESLLRENAAKEVSKKIFDNDPKSDVDDDENGKINERKNEKVTVFSGDEDERRRSDAGLRLLKIYNKKNKKKGKLVKGQELAKSKVKSKKHKSDSDDVENSSADERSKEVLEIEKVQNRRRVFLDESDEETEGSAQTNGQVKEKPIQNEGPHGREEANSGSSQSSDSSSRKRRRQDHSDGTHSSDAEDSDAVRRFKAKRLRCIGSDSDSDVEDPSSGTSRGRIRPLVDSDSDLEPNLIDDK